jgi:NAD(P)-dependent dehydrogenase (short-subunit alcohol dehydrogenase family)/dienelactone hydrolase
MGRLSGKVALITGTAGGQGRAAALLFAREGARVVGCDLKAAGAEETVARVCAVGGEMISMAPVDLAVPEQASRWVSEAVAAYGGIDILYNNASTGRVGPFASLSLESWQFTLRNELDLIYLVTRAAWPHLMARGAGSVINTGSIIAAHGTDMPMPAHGAAKAGVVALTVHLAIEGGPHGIRVNAISPGLIGTEMFEEHLKDPFDNMHKQVRTSPLGRVGRAEDVARVALFLASEDSAYVTGTNIVVDGGQTLGVGMSFGRTPSPTSPSAPAATVPATRVTSIQIPTPDGTADAYLVTPEGNGPWPGVLLYTDIMGVRPVFLDMARRLAAAGFVVLLPNLFYRSGPPADPPLSIHRSGEFGQLLALAQGLTRAMIERDGIAYTVALRAQRSTAAGALGCVGYCMSGAFAIATAASCAQDFGAVAAFHPGHLSTTSPESPDRLATRTRAKYCFGFAETDPFMTPEAIAQLRARLTDGGVAFETEVYPATYHGFAITDAAYESRAAERHWEKLIEFLRRSLKSD